MKFSPSEQQLFQLQQLDPDTWTRLLRFNTGDDLLRVASVQTEQSGPQQTRYSLTLEGYHDTITLLGRRTNIREARFYAELAGSIPVLVSRCWFSHISDQDGWVMLSDAPHDRLPEHWMAGDVSDIVSDLADLHATYWGRKDDLFSYDWLPLLLGAQRKRNRHALGRSAEQNNADELSDHALRSVQGLAPRWSQAHAGMQTLIDLDGWPGVISEKHIRAMADLLDDPVPMLFPLRQLPLTLVHGFAGIYNWRVNSFDSRRLVDWQSAAIGPGICDLVTFIETFGLLQDSNMLWRVRDGWPMAEETIIDNYILQLSAELGNDAQAREMRQAIPAARCLHILLTWLPRFDKWFSQLPSDIEARRDIWRSINAYGEDELAGTIYAPIAGLRPWLAETFHRFLRSYYQLTG